MRAVLRIELIGDDFHYYKRTKTKSPDQLWQMAKRFGFNETRPWVAKITGLDDRFGFKREFQRGTRDYSQANSTGSRGIFCYYPLKPGLYEINERLSWKRTKRWFARVEDCKITEITKEEVIQCLKLSESTTQENSSA